MWLAWFELCQTYFPLNANELTIQQQLEAIQPAPTLLRSQRQLQELT
jgi:hypothetical protein